MSKVKITLEVTETDLDENGLESITIITRETNDLKVGLEMGVVADMFLSQYSNKRRKEFIEEFQMSVME